MGQSTADRVMATGRPGAPEAEMQKWKIHQAKTQSPSSENADMRNAKIQKAKVRNFISSKKIIGTFGAEDAVS